MSAFASLAQFRIRPGMPGVRRSQLIDPRPGVADAAIEDDFHHFLVAVHHDGARVTDIVTSAVRWPWTTCPSAGAHLAQRLTGAALDALAAVDPPQAHCTHMHELALLAASHAGDSAPVLYSSFVGDLVDGLQEGEVWINGAQALAWTFRGTQIVSEGPLAGRDLRQYRKWESELDPDLRRAAKVLRRMVHVSGGRRFNYGLTPVAANIAASVGACFTFQPERSGVAGLTMDLRDFTNGPPPLAERIGAVMERLPGA